jgi:hypothetical protein
LQLESRKAAASLYLSNVLVRNACFSCTSIAITNTCRTHDDTFKNLLHMGITTLRGTRINQELQFRCCMGIASRCLRTQLHAMQRRACAVRFLGPLVEKIIVSGIKEGYEKLPEVVRRYKEKHPGKLGKVVPGEGPLQLARRLSRGQSRMLCDP